MPLVKLAILAVVQGFAELLPISSSAHVVVAEELLGLDPSAPSMTLLLVMLHTGTMFAVIVYFWRQWREAFLSSAQGLRHFAAQLILATALTGGIGYPLARLVVHLVLGSTPHAQIEDLFNHLGLIAPALAVVGILIIVAGLLVSRRSDDTRTPGNDKLGIRQAALIGAIQGLSLPFRGFSRSGATISAGMLSGVAKARAEAFSFALAVVITPAVVGRELLRLVQLRHIDGAAQLTRAIWPSMLGAALAFLAGLLALRWLSRWLEKGRWHYFGIYCLIAAVGVETLHHFGY